LSGEAADAQPSTWEKVADKPETFAPSAHKASHENGGADETSIAGLSGEAADEQKSAWTKVSGKPATFPPSTHKTSHQNGGADEISIAGLSGEAADAQPSTWAKVADKPTTLIHSTAVLADNKLISGDGGSRNVKDCHIVVSDDGEMTNPSQPCFNVNPAATQSDIAIDTNVVVVFDVERIDQGNNFADNCFTAPVDGSYLLCAALWMVSVDIDSSYLQARITTSNKTYYTRFDPDFTADGHHPLTINVIADMDANDTAYVQIQIIGGTVNADVALHSLFSGHLVC